MVKFFYLNNIKIHFDPTEYGLDTIIKQIALDKLGGCSIGKLRSYPSELDGKFLGYYSNDIFFTWGSDSTNYLAKSENYIDNYVISGFPYKLNNFTKKTVNKIKNQFINQGVKFTILILDTNHSDNKSHYFQYIPTSILINFYKQIINLLNIDNRNWVIIKSKKILLVRATKI